MFGNLLVYQMRKGENKGLIYLKCRMIQKMRTLNVRKLTWIELKSAKIIEKMVLTKSDDCGILTSLSAGNTPGTHRKYDP